MKIILRGPKTNSWNFIQIFTTVLVSELHIDIFKIWRESCDIILQLISLSRRKVSVTSSSYYFQTLFFVMIFKNCTSDVFSIFEFSNKLDKIPSCRTKKHA